MTKKPDGLYHCACGLSTKSLFAAKKHLEGHFRHCLCGHIAGDHVLDLFDSRRKTLALAPCLGKGCECDDFNEELISGTPYQSDFEGMEGENNE